MDRYFKHFYFQLKLFLGIVVTCVLIVFFITIVILL